MTTRSRAANTSTGTTITDVAHPTSSTTVLSQTSVDQPIQPPTPPTLASGLTSVHAPIASTVALTLASVPANVWHEDAWLSTALHAELRQVVPGHRQPLPPRIERRVQQDSKHHRALFADNSTTPLAIFTVRMAPGSETEAMFEIPPPSARLDIIARAHQLGHFGTEKTQAQVETQGFWWTGLSQDVATLVSRCTACQRDNVHQALHHAARSIPIPTGVFDRVHMDILSLPESTHEPPLRYVLLFVCALSKYPVAFALADKEMSTVAAKL